MDEKKRSFCAVNVFELPQGIFLALFRVDMYGEGYLNMYNGKRDKKSLKSVFCFLLLIPRGEDKKFRPQTALIIVITTPVMRFFC